MASALKPAQFVDEADSRTFGFWPPALLDPGLVSDPESSGTGFFVAALAWGVHTGRLSAAEYLPIAERGWRALVRAQQPDGRIGWVQQIGSGPEAVEEAETQLYGAGAFLQAAARMLQFVEGSNASAPVGDAPGAAPIRETTAVQAPGGSPQQSATPIVANADSAPSSAPHRAYSCMLVLLTAGAMLISAL